MKKSISEQTRAYYDAEAEVYDRVRYSTTAGRRVAQFHINAIRTTLSSYSRRGDKVLEVGCGTGRLLAEIGSDGFSMFGIDASQRMLDMARARIAEKGVSADLREGDALCMPYPDNTFDAAFSLLVVNLIPDYKSLLREIARVLKPGGVFLFNVPNLASIYFPGGLYVNLRGRTVGENRAGPRYSHWFLPREWKGALNQAGFYTLAVIGQPPLVRMIENARPLGPSWLSLLFAKSLYITARRIDQQA